MQVAHSDGGMSLNGPFYQEPEAQAWKDNYVKPHQRARLVCIPGEPA